MKTENMTSTNGNKVANQFIITDDIGNQYFQSYNSMIVKKINCHDWYKIELDKKYILKMLVLILDQIKNIGTLATQPANIEIYF